MKRLAIFDKSGNAVIDLKRILNVIAPLAPDSTWRIGDYVEDDGSRWLEFADDGSMERRFADASLGLTTHDLVVLAETMPQAIWASFAGFHLVQPAEPWILLSAIDSHFWRVETDDREIERAVWTGFAYVSEGSI